MDNSKNSKNIVLIGMPGCGKTSIGNKLANNLNMQFIDMDQYIENKTKTTIPELFKIGEEYFRTVETEATREISVMRSSIISTGGGIIKKNNNITMLKENSIIFFIDRPINLIAADVITDTRPLLKDGVHKLYELYEERYHLYKSSADYVVVNDKEIQRTVFDIILLYENQKKKD